MPRTNRLTLACVLFLLAGCGNGTVIGSGPNPTSPSVTPNVSFEYSVPTAASAPATIVTGSNGFLYFTELSASKIGQLTTGGSFTELATKTAAAAPESITVGPNGNLWWTENAIHSIGTVTPAFNTAGLTEYPIPWAGSQPAFIARGVNQNSLYFTDPGANAIGEILTNGTFTGPFAIPTANANPEGIAIGPDNKMWFTENNAAKIGFVDPVTNAVTEMPISPGSNPSIIILGPDGAMWFTENISGAAKLGRITSTHVYSEFPLTGAKSAAGLTQDAFGHLVVTDPANSAIGVFDITSQKYTEYPTKTASSSPLWITIGPDGKLYFTEYTANKIGQFTYF